MFYLHVSNRTENLLHHLAEVIRVGERSDPFAPEVFLIQSLGVERMISQAMAVRFQSWCNFDYLLPFAFLEDIAGKLGLEITPDRYERKILTWRLDGLLRDLDGEVFGELRRYIAGENAALKRFQLAYRLANVFDQYQMMRPDLLAAWDDGRLVASHPSEPWQMALWQRLASGTGEVPHRGVLLGRVIDKLRDQTELSRILPARITVFGLHTMPPLFLQCLQGVSRHTDVHLHLLSPCRQYWGDIEGERRRIKTRLARLEKGLAADPEVTGGHPLLASLGGQGRDFQEMLIEGIEFECEFNSFSDPLEDGEPTLLHRLQSDILNDRAVFFDGEKLSADDSLIFVSCHSQLREIEVLKEHLLRLLYTDQALELRDIIVMAPDIHDYAALIPAVFDDIQHTIADRTLRSTGGIINAFLAFLELYDGRFGLCEVLDLLRDEAVFPNFDLAAGDLEVIEGWATEAGIRWGLSADQRLELNLPDMAENTWVFGLERLLMGVAIDTDEMVDGILPFPDIEGSQAGILGGLCGFVDLCARAEHAFRQPRSLTDWSALLLEYADDLFGDPEGEGLPVLREMLMSLAERYAAFHDRPVEIRVVRDWLSHSIQESRNASGFLHGSLTFCSMLPMRSIPFKVICLLGMSDAEFPRNDSWATFDLMAPPNSRPGDRSVRADDRYQFLEAILAARKALLVSYVGRSIKSNEPIPPSVMVTELLEILQTAYGVEDPVVEHPLQPFSARYFNGDEGRLFSYSAAYCAAATCLQQKQQESGPWWSGERSGQERETDPVQVRYLIGFFADPQRYFIKESLGIRLVSERDPPEDRETFAVAGLDAYLIDREMVEADLAELEATGLLTRLKACGRWPLGTPGDIEFSHKLKEISILADAVRAQNMGARLPDRLIDCRIHGYQLQGKLDHIHENGILLARPASLKGKDLLAGWIHHLLLRFFPECPQRTVILAKDDTVTFGEDEDAQPDLAALLEIFTAGRRRPSPLLVEPALAYVRQLHAPRSVIPPLIKARTCLQDHLDKGYAPEWALLFRGLEAEEIIGEDFERLCLSVIDPVWRRAHAT